MKKKHYIKSLSIAQIREFQRRWSEGATRKEMASIFQVPEPTVRYWVRALGMCRNHGGQPNRPGHKRRGPKVNLNSDQEKVVELFIRSPDWKILNRNELARKKKEILEFLGISRSTLWRIMQRNNWQ